MSKRTLGLIVVLIVITGILFYFALSQPNPQPPPATSLPIAVTSPVPIIVPAHTLLSLTADTPGTISVQINTNGDNVTAVQLDMSYDPTVLTNVKVTKANFFDQSIELFNQVNTKDGNISYAIAIQPTGQPKIGTGVVATITYQRLTGQNQATMIKFLGKSKVTAEGISPSILKSTTDLTIPAVQ